MFSKDRALKRAMDKATNKMAQSADRSAAMHKLANVGSDEALYALCRRFAFKYDKTIEDQQEKAWVVDTLVGKGEVALPAVKRYMKESSSLHYPLTILGRIADAATVLGILDEILAEEPPGYTRDPERRTDILAYLSEFDEASNAETARRAIPYLADFDENVRYKAVDCIALKPDAAAAEPLVQALVREEEESRRLRVRIAEVLAENQWDLGEHKSQVTELLEPGQALETFKMHHDKLVPRDS